MLEKNKDYLEMRVSSTDFAFTQNEPVHLCVEGLVDATNGRFPGPGDDYILISKEKFEALQTENEQLKKKLEEFSPVPGYREFLTELYPEDNVEKLVWATEQIFSHDRWKFWKDNYEALDKLVGFSSVEEIEDYLVNEAECDTLHEDILKLHDEVGIYKRTLKEWKEGTGCPSPAVAKSIIESGMSWNHAYNEAKEKNRKLTAEVESWKNVTGYSTPEDYIHARISGAFHTPFDYTAAWQKATSCSTPEEAKELISSKNRGIVELKNKLDASLKENEQSKEKYDQAIEMIGEWQRATGHFLPKVADEELASLKKEVSDYKKQIESWQEVTGCKTTTEAKDWVNELGEANGNLAHIVLSWQEVTGFKTPEEAKDYWTTKLSESGEVSESFAREVRSWQEITGFSTPEKCSSYIDTLEKKLEDIKDLIEED